MEMTGERRIAASRERVWAALNDPDVLKASIPGCESIERTAEDEFQARVAVKLGPMSARFGGKVQFTNINPPASYTISGEGQGGAMGFAKGGADVALEEVAPEETLLRYGVKAQVGGKMAQQAHAPVAARTPAAGRFAPASLLSSNFLGFPFQVWFGLAAMLVIILLVFFTG